MKTKVNKNSTSKKIGSKKKISKTETINISVTNTKKINSNIKNNYNNKNNSKINFNKNNSFIILKSLISKLNTIITKNIFIKLKLHFENFRNFDYSKQITLCKQFTLLLIILTIITMVLGPLVRAKNAGLACPDWPLCYGKFIPKMTLQIFLEWFHRVIAGLLSVLFIIWVGVLVYFKNLSKTFYISLILALFFLVLQIILGALTITELLDVYVVKSHLLNSLLFLSVLVTILHKTIFLENSLKNNSNKKNISNIKFVSVETFSLINKFKSFFNNFNNRRFLVFLLTLVIFLQIFMGARVSVNQAGLVCNEFPACYQEAVIDLKGKMTFENQYFPPMIGSLEKHMSHRFFAYFLFLFVSFLFLFSKYKKWDIKITKYFLIIFSLVSFQIIIGALNVIFQLPVAITVFHSFIAYTIYLSSFWLFLETKQIK